MATERSSADTLGETGAAGPARSEAPTGPRSVKALPPRQREPRRDAALATGPRSRALYLAAHRALTDLAGWPTPIDAVAAARNYPPSPETEGMNVVTKGGLLGLIDLVGKPECVREARAFVRERLGPDHPALEDVELLVSELVTNSVRHSNSRDGGQITVVLASIPDGIHAMVIDDGADTTPRVRTDLDGEGGRGMFLVDQLAQRWGTKDDAAGRAVWFEVKCRPRGRRPAPASRTVPGRGG